MRNACRGLIAAGLVLLLAGTGIAAERQTGTVTGKLAIKDVTRTVDIPLKYLGKKPHPDPKMACVDVSGYETAFTLNRLEYHVGDGRFFRMGMLGDTVDLKLAGEVLSERPGCAKPAP